MELEYSAASAASTAAAAAAAAAACSWFSFLFLVSVLAPPLCHGVLVEAEDTGRGLARALLEDWAAGCTDCASDCCLEQQVPMFRDFSVEF